MSEKDLRTGNAHQFKSNFGFLMAAVGSAVGLGNIWGFPYKMGLFTGIRTVSANGYCGIRAARSWSLPSVEPLSTKLILCLRLVLVKLHHYIIYLLFVAVFVFFVVSLQFNFFSMW